MTRAEAATKLCKRLALDVTSIAPAGTGHWPETREIVATSDAEFMVALTAWEATGSEDNRAKVRTAYTRVVSVWHEAVRVYEEQRQGTP